MPAFYKEKPVVIPTQCASTSPPELILPENPVWKPYWLDTVGRTKIGLTVPAGFNAEYFKTIFTKNVAQSLGTIAWFPLYTKYYGQPFLGYSLGTYDTPNSTVMHYPEYFVINGLFIYLAYTYDTSKDENQRKNFPKVMLVYDEYSMEWVRAENLVSSYTDLSTSTAYPFVMERPVHLNHFLLLGCDSLMAGASSAAVTGQILVNYLSNFSEVLNAL